MPLLFGFMNVNRYSIHQIREANSLWIGTLSTTRALPVRESDLVQPRGIGMHGKIAVHLEGHIHLMHA